MTEDEIKKASDFAKKWNHYPDNKLDPEVSRDILKSISKSSDNASENDLANQSSNKETTKDFFDLLKSGMKAATSSEERAEYAKMGADADIRQKEHAERSAMRSADTQQGAMKVSLLHGVLAAGGMAAIGYYAYKNKDVVGDILKNVGDAVGSISPEQMIK